ncbi:MAG: SDR family NAD(P)-dependent oxidoreductase [Gammaproteobacteria bacterium]|nr:SDR family NAD(P)-dependent oxidoreductase [Gammaproteobacteria bacterium]
MGTLKLPFAERYGRWTMVAGASEGLGLAFAHDLASRGLNLLLIARRAALLDEAARDVRTRHGVEVRCLALDLADPGLTDSLADAIAGLEIGVVVYNAAFVPVGEFVDIDYSDLERVARVNVLGPLAVLNSLLPPMRERGRGAVVLMSSLAGLQGTPRVAAYAATKAFNTILAEGLWAELRSSGIEVVGCCAGAIRTPGYLRAVTGDLPGMLSSEAVARRTLDALGKGPRTVPGRLNRISAQFVTRLLTRRAAVRLIAANTKDLH